VPADTPNGEGLDALDIATVCRRARVGRSFVYEEIRAGRLIARKYGRLTRILVNDYHRWLNRAPPIEPASAIVHDGEPPLNDAVNKTRNARRGGGPMSATEIASPLDQPGEPAARSSSSDGSVPPRRTKAGRRDMSAAEASRFPTGGARHDRW
jgi:hypothetical protein